jgi:hypothetical protein
MPAAPLSWRHRYFNYIKSNPEGEHYDWEMENGFIHRSRDRLIDNFAGRGQGG